MAGSVAKQESYFIQTALIA